MAKTAGSVVTLHKCAVTAACVVTDNVTGATGAQHELPCSCVTAGVDKFPSVTARCHWLLRRLRRRGLRRLGMGGVASGHLHVGLAIAGRRRRGAGRPSAESVRTRFVLIT